MKYFSEPPGDFLSSLYGWLVLGIGAAWLLVAIPHLVARILMSDTKVSRGFLWGHLLFPIVALGVLGVLRAIVVAAALAGIELRRGGVQVSYWQGRYKPFMGEAVPTLGIHPPLGWQWWMDATAGLAGVLLGAFLLIRLSDRVRASLAGGSALAAEADDSFPTRHRRGLKAFGALCLFLGGWLMLAQFSLGAPGAPAGAPGSALELGLYRGADL